MINTWNIVEKENVKTVWKDLDETNYEEIKNVEKEVGSEPYFCKQTNSVVFKTSSPEIKMVRGQNYSELELISRYLTTENKLYDLLNS
jgi:hypothetical protein